MTSSRVDDDLVLMANVSVKLADFQIFSFFLSLNTIWILISAGEGRTHDLQDTWYKCGLWMRLPARRSGHRRKFKAKEQFFRVYRQTFLWSFEKTVQENYTVNDEELITARRHRGALSFRIDALQEVLIGERASFNIVPASPGLVFFRPKYCRMQKGCSKIWCQSHSTLSNYLYLRYHATWVAWRGRKGFLLRSSNWLQNGHFRHFICTKDWFEESIGYFAKLPSNKDNNFNFKGFTVL